MAAAESFCGTSCGRPRLVINEMVLRNFKSYAGEQRIGPFHKSFSAVVGPNGSGKSNVIDAMLFVFGKRAKQMRLNKVSELIHNSSNHQNLESAGVSVHFQEIIDLDNGSYEAVEGSDFVITRVAFQDNTSKYYINDRSSNFTEVTKKLKGKGVDLDNNRFLILQGEVEQISLMKPKSQGIQDEGFLEYLEDIIGTNQYVEKIDEAHKKLETLNEKRASVVQMVRLAEKERDNLENVKNEAESYMLKELTLLKCHEIVTKLASDDATFNVSELQEKLVTLECSLTSEREKIQTNSKLLKELEFVHNKYMKRQEELDNDLKNCREQFKEFERQDVKYREDSKHMKQKIKKLDDKIEKDSTKVDEISNGNVESSNAIPKLEEDLSNLQQLLIIEEKILEEIKESSRGETERLRCELIEVHTELEPWENKLRDHKGKLNVAVTESNILKEKHDGSRAAFEDAKKQAEHLYDKMKLRKSSIDEIQIKLDNNNLEELEARRLEQECINKQDMLIPLEKAARQKVTEIASILESEKSQGSVLKAILAAKESNEIEGIYGRLGDLGAIDSKYNIAVSTACPGLDYILVETTIAAQKCVDLLRRKNVGVATFMILEKQADQLNHTKAKVKTPEGVPRLFDLITVADERLKLAFYAALGNTVVANDLDQATRIAYGSNKDFRRVVTLEGAVFEKSGTMSGGGAKPHGGKMGTSIKSSVSAEALSNAEKELGELVNQLVASRQMAVDAVRRYHKAEKDQAQLKMELAKIQKEIDSLSMEHGYIEIQLDSLRAAAQPNKEELNRLEELDRIISSEEKEIERLLGCSSELREQVSELQSKIENAGSERMKNQKLKVEKIESDIDKTNTEINHQKVKIVTGEKTMKKLVKSIEESKKEREKVVEEREKMSSVFKETEQRAFVVRENYEKTQELVDKHKDVLDETKVEYTKLKKTLDDLRAAEVDDEYRLRDLKKLLKDLEMKLTAYNRRLDDLQRDFVQHVHQIQKDAVDPEKLRATIDDDSLKDVSDLKRAMEMVALLEAQLKDMNPNLEAISEYRRKNTLYNERAEELDAATQERDELKRQYDGLRKKRLDEFMAGFNAISLKLKEMYQMITLGGDAELELVDSLDPFSEGVVFSVRPPKKSWKNISNLSGGEKTLSSLALIFALHHYKPTPLYVMDEIDAALDFKNVSIVGHYVKDRTRDAQFIIISLRNNMFELADRLVGIYKTENCTKSVTINPASFADCSKSTAT